MDDIVSLQDELELRTKAYWQLKQMYLDAVKDAAIARTENASLREELAAWREWARKFKCFLGAYREESGDNRPRTLKELRSWYNNLRKFTAHHAAILATPRRRKISG
jgi:hypothetical protein